MLNAGNDFVAVIFIRLLYIFWFVEDSILTLAVVWAGSRLIIVLDRHLFQFRVTGERYSSIKGGILKVLSFFFLVCELRSPKSTNFTYLNYRSNSLSLSLPLALVDLLHSCLFMEFYAVIL